MKRTDADGFAPGNLYTEGNPGLGVPATVVGAEEMNNIQEEIVAPILAAGIALDGGTTNQLLQALDILIAGGGSSQIKQDLENNQTDTDITGFIFDKASVKSFRAQVDLERRTDTASEQRNQTGTLFGSVNVESNTWEPLSFVAHEPTSEEANDAELTFLIDPATGQVSYNSTNFVGSNYSGNIRIWDIKKAAI